MRHNVPRYRHGRPGTLLGLSKFIVKILFRRRTPLTAAPLEQKKKKKKKSDRRRTRNLSCNKTVGKHMSIYAIYSIGFLNPQLPSFLEHLCRRRAHHICILRWGRSENEQYSVVSFSMARSDHEIMIWQARNFPQLSTVTRMFGEKNPLII